MKVASFFTGIGGFDLGFQRAGHEIVFQCEIDRFCNRILDRHWPNVTRAGDILAMKDAAAVPTAEVWCAGFPCQDASHAIRRKRIGLGGTRTGLFFAFLKVLRQRLPEFVVLENVLGLLTAQEGADFGTILRSLDGLGYAVCWRVLNSQYFGVPQFRRRLYVVGALSGPTAAARALLEPGQTAQPPRPKSEKSPLKTAVGDGRNGPVVQKIAYCLAATAGRHTGNDWSRTYVAYPSRVRRLMPEEGERLQGFPVGWTLPAGVTPSKRSSYDSARYAALGNAVSVPTVEWIARRLHSDEARS
jgi:DNA (cytosine-5)-methyltransferase 1